MSPELDLFEVAAQEAVMQRHETRHQQRLRVIREAMAAKYRSRVAVYGQDKAWISGNDVRRWLERHPEWDVAGSANWRAAVFASKDWAWRGDMIRSTARKGHRVKIQCYRLREAR